MQLCHSAVILKWYRQAWGVLSGFQLRARRMGRGSCEACDGGVYETRPARTAGRALHTITLTLTVGV